MYDEYGREILTFKEKLKIALFIILLFGGPILLTIIVSTR